MKQILSIALVLGVISIGCSKEEEELPVAAPNTSIHADPLAAGGQQSAPPDPMTMIPKPAETLIDITTVERPADNSGRVMDDLAYLNHLVFNINEGRATYVSDNIPTFKDDAQRQAYEMALAKAREPLKDINDLVRLKVVKALPPAPAGKRYAINETTGKVEMVNQ
ncbi:MAG: hypothetical protein ACO1QS_00380 [Verrucomicrobiota bacterium]